MFKHLITYNLKIFFGNREGVAYSIIFPLVFGMIYLFAFQGFFSNDTTYPQIPVAIVRTGNTEESAASEAIATIGEIKDNTIVAKEANEALLVYVETSETQARTLLEDGIVDHIIYIDTNNNQFKLSLEIAPNAVNDLSSSIVYAALDHFSSIRGAVMSLYNDALATPNPPATIARIEEKIRLLDSQDSALTSHDATENISSMSVYYYASLAYLCIYFMALGISIVTENEANYSASALLMTASPVQKWKRFTVTFMIAAVSSISVMLLLLYIFHQNGVPLGNDPLRMVALISTGVLVGLLMGTTLASVLKGKLGLLTGLSIALPLLFGALSGLMAVELKYFLMKTVPILSKLNPVALINDAMYYLNNYPTYDQYNQNMLILGGYALVGLIMTIVALRRTDYENL